MTVAETILFGVLSGVIASLVTFALIQIGQKMLLPGYRAMIYRGVDLNGEWHQYHPNAIHQQRGSIELIQKANAISGQAIFSTDSETSERYGVDTARTFCIRGEVEDRFVRLWLDYRDNTRIGKGGMLLEVVGDGRKMVGVEAYYDVGGAEIVSHETVLVRELPVDRPRP